MKTGQDYFATRLICRADLRGEGMFLRRREGKLDESSLEETVYKTLIRKLVLMQRRTVCVL